jgi:DNA uptake protein ComE-like DNA-binding protein
MTPPEIAAIIDYRDPDQTVTPNGAELAEYAAMQPPYMPRDGPFRTPRELLMVRGLSRELFLGEDVNQNGLLDPDEDDGSESYPSDNQNGVLDAGWAGMITINSSVRNLNAAGQERVNIKEASETALAAVPGLTAELAKAIVQYRGQNQFNNLADLLDVTAVNRQQQDEAQAAQVQTSGQGGQPGRSSAPTTARPTTPSNAQPTTTRSSTTGSQRGATGQGGGGAKLISEELFIEIADHLTTQSESEQAGLVNINTAPPEVLECLPGITHELAQSIVQYRRSIGSYRNLGWLLKAPGMNQQIFKQVVPRLTARSETYRILSEGRVDSTGARKRIMATVRIGTYSVDTLSFREDL